MHDGAAECGVVMVMELCIVKVKDAEAGDGEGEACVVVGEDNVHSPCHARLPSHTQNADIWPDGKASTFWQCKRLSSWCFGVDSEATPSHTRTHTRTHTHTHTHAHTLHHKRVGSGYAISKPCSA